MSTPRFIVATAMECTAGGFVEAEDDAFAFACVVALVAAFAAPFFRAAFAIDVDAPIVATGTTSAIAIATIRRRGDDMERSI
jgi:hypothetical protein